MVIREEACHPALDSFSMHARSVVGFAFGGERTRRRGRYGASAGSTGARALVRASTRGRRSEPAIAKANAEELGPRHVRAAPRLLRKQRLATSGTTAENGLICAAIQTRCHRFLSLHWNRRGAHRRRSRRAPQLATRAVSGSKLGPFPSRRHLRSVHARHRGGARRAHRRCRFGLKARRS